MAKPHPEGCPACSGRQEEQAGPRQRCLFCARRWADQAQPRSGGSRRSRTLAEEGAEQEASLRWAL